MSSSVRRRPAFRTLSVLRLGRLRGVIIWVRPVKATIRRVLRGQVAEVSERRVSVMAPVDC